MCLIEAIYTRQSVDRVDSISVESQVEFCQREVVGENVKIYTDKGYSGKDTDRPAFREMMSDILSGKIRRVIVYRLDRISRSVLDFASVIDIFQKYGVDFVSTMEKFDTGTPIGKAMLMIVMIFAQLERETIQRRVVDAYSSRSRRGFYMGGKVPYGFRLKETSIDGVRTKMYEPVPEEAAVVEQIFSLYAQPQISLGDVVRWLDERRIRKRGGGSFSRGRVRDLIVNPVYVRADHQIYAFYKAQGTSIEDPPEDFLGTNGAYLYSGHEEKRKTVSLRGHILVLAPHEGLIAPDVWIKCRSKCLCNVSAAKPMKVRATWLAGKIRCGYCGHTLSAKVYHCKTKADNRYYLCRNQGHSGGCRFGSLDADVVDEIIFEELERKLAGFHTLTKREQGSCDVQMIRRRSRMEVIDQEIDSFLDKIPLADAVTMEYINGRIAALEGEKRQLYAETVRHTESGRSGPRAITDYLRRWGDLEIGDKLAVADSVVESIFASQEKITINWKI